MGLYLSVLKKYAVFSGRASRKEYWMFYLISIIIALVLGLIEGIVAFNPERDVSVLASIFSFAILLPSIAVSVRRLHDIGRSGWWLLIAFVPLIGPIILLVFLLKDSSSGENKYGDRPKVP